MKQKEIYRTATFAWSPTSSLPLIATGTVAGALDESFSNESQLEIWQPDFMNKNEFYLGAEVDSRPKGVVTDTSRFNRIAWGQVHKDRSRGVIAAGMENGELTFWDPAKIVQHADASECLILRNTSHTGPVRGLDFNPIQTNLLSTGAVNGEVYIWDLNDPSKPYSPTPGSRSTKLDEITSVAWNQQVQYVLAGASSTGYTVVWDLRGKREVVALAYGGGAGTLGGAVGSGMAVGGRRGMSAIAWHPDNATRLVTASEDDMSPVIMVWDLRNARAPEKILTGHEKGVLSLSWCKQDADLLLSCGKDNRALCWNPQTSEIIGELPSADNWAFQVEWCPHNPDLLATAFFSGTIGIHSIQSTNALPSSSTSSVPPTPKPSGAELFDAPLSLSHPDQSSLGLSLKQPPRWLRRPVSASFGFGGKLVSVSNLPNGQGKAQSSVVHLRGVSGEKSLVERVSKLRRAAEESGLEVFAEDVVGGDVQAQGKEGTETWKALLSLFRANSRDELVMLLGYSKEEVKTRVQQAIASLKEAQRQQTPALHYSADEDGVEHRAHEPVVSFAEPEAEADVEQEGETEADGEKTSSEVSVSDVVHADGESATTAPSLFGDDHIGMPQLNADTGADFFSTMAASQETDAHETQTIVVPHTNYGIDSSVAATIGSGPSSVASASESLSLKSNTFRIYPSEESETDRLVTRALVLGDFESAVELCLESERYADALLLAIKGGDELLQRTQKAYFERRTTEHPYLRLFQSIVTNDLADVVQNADLVEWAEVFVVLCTFASAEEFGGLAEQLGARLEFQAGILRSEADGEGGTEGALELRKTATLTYLAAGRLERLVNIWVEELAEEEDRRIHEEALLDSSRYAAHAHALQTFIEKVTVFRGAIKYVDSDLAIVADGADGPTKTYKLAALYDRYFEYAEMLAAQGLVKEAVDYLKLTPGGYTGSALDFAAVRERLLVASGQSTRPSTASASPKVADTYQPPVSSSLDQTGRYTPARPAYQPVQPSAPYQPYPSQYNGASTGYTSGVSYAPQQPLVKPPSLTQPPPTRPPVSSVPPPSRTQNGGWNDAPPVKNERRTPSSLSTSKAKPDAIVSPFPNAAQSPSTPGSPFAPQSAQLPPPPRPASVQSKLPPPPPARTTMPPSQGRPVTGPPPTRIMSPPQTHVPPPPHATTGSYSSPHVAPVPLGQSGEPYARATPPPGPPRGSVAPPAGPYARATPPPGPAAPSTQPPPGPYAPPPIQAGPPTLQHQQPGPYAPPPLQYPPSVGQPGSYAPPVSQQQHAPPQVRGPPQGQHSLPAPPPAQQRGPPGGAPPAPPPARAPVQRGPPPPKYPSGDRSHIPESAIPIYNVVSEQLVRLKQITPPQQKRIVEDLERRINPLFDALNCETLSKPVADQLLVLIRAMEAHDRELALAIHVDLLTRGSQTDDIGLWMSAIKQLIVRL